MALTNGVLLEWPAPSGFSYGLEFSFDGESWVAQGEPRSGDGFYSAYEYSMPHKAAVEGRLTSQAGFAQVVFGNGIFLGRDGDGHASVSRDEGVTWLQQPTVLPQSRIHFGNGRFVTYQPGEAHSIFLSSADGVYWVRRAVPGFMRALAFGDGSFCAVAEGRTWQSYDGVDWVGRATTTDANPVLDLAVGNGLMVLLRGHPEKANQAHVSEDHGGSFRQHRVAVVGERVCYGAGLFVGVGVNGRITVSTNGVTWSARVTNAFALYGVHHGPHGFVAVGDHGTVWRSTNGLHWSSTQLTGNRLWDCASATNAMVFYGNFGGVITVGVPNYFRLRRTSESATNIISMVERPSDDNLPRTPYLDGKGDLILPAIPGKTYQLLTSADGLSWEPLGGGRSATNGVARWPRGLLATGRALWRVDFQDERRTLAEIYFGRGKGFAAAAALVAQRTSELLLAENAVRSSRNVTDGMYFSQLEIMNQIYWLRWDDGVATNYSGVIKGRIARLAEDIVPFWTEELLKAQPYPEWKTFTTAAVTNNKLWLSIERQQRTLLETHEESYVAGRALDFEYNIRNQKLNIIAQREYALSLERRWWSSSLTNYGFTKQILNLSADSVREIVLSSDVINASGRLAPSILRSPDPALIDTGDDIVLTASAQGAEPLSYQWQRNGADISQATGAQLVLRQAKLTDAGQYRVVVRNDVGVAQSRAALIEIRKRSTAPVVIGPDDLHIPDGGRAVFDIVVQGGGTFDYSWYHDGNLLRNETGPQLARGKGGVTDVGRYWVVVRSERGTTTSRVAALWVGRPPTIDLQPFPQTVVEGQPVRFVVHAEGEHPLGYQWHREGVPIFGANSAEWALPRATRELAGGLSVVVSNSAGVVTSQVVLLQIGVAPAIVVPPRGTNLLAGATARLAVVATGTEPLQFQWFKDGLPLAGAYGEELWQLLVQPRHAGRYTVSVSNWVGVAMSDVAELVVAPDTQRPHIEVLEPRPNSRHAQGAIVARGLAADNVAVAEINVVLNGAEAQRAQGTTNWSRSLLPRIGENLLLVWSMDGSGNQSKPVRRKFFYVPNPFAAAAGSYEGLFVTAELPKAATSGFIKLTVSKQGAFSGRLTSGLWRSNVRGAFDVTGHATQRLSSHDGADRALVLDLDLSNNDRIVGELQSSGDVSEIRLQKTTNHSGALAGTYNLVFVPNDSFEADSSGVATINARGRVTLRVALSGGERVLHRSTLNQQRSWALYSPLYRGQGAILGWLSLADDEGKPVHGSVTWLKPSGPQGEMAPLVVNVFGSPVLPEPVTSSSGNLVNRDSSPR